MHDLVRIRRALISVSDKTDLVPFARALESFGVEIISTGGTASALAAAGIRCVQVSEVTGFPEIMDGRIKTLHPLVHGGLLADREKPGHVDAMREHGIEPIDLVCINLYPFEQTVADPGVTVAEAIENIDVGGPTMVRAGAKNHRWVTVVTSPRWYDRVIAAMREHDGCVPMSVRESLAASAFGMTAAYDAAISEYLGRRSGEAFPRVLRLGYTLVDELRYGENPHQAAALYRDPSASGASVVGAKQLHGKELSYNNINDAAAALELVASLGADGGGVAAAVVKHMTPCGAASGEGLAGVVAAAFAGDPVAAYGGILACSVRVDAEAAGVIAAPERFLEVIVAPGYGEDALEVLRGRWVNVRILEVGPGSGRASRRMVYRSVPGGMLVQEGDVKASEPGRWVHAAGPVPTAARLSAAAGLEMVCKHVASNAVVIGGAKGSGFELFGVGGGQVDRVTACRIAVEKAGARARGAIAVSDAFFPFSDGPAVLADGGVSMIVHPGGSKRDGETVELCNGRGVTCMTTGVRHFRH